MAPIASSHAQLDARVRNRRRRDGACHSDEAGCERPDIGQGK